MMRMSDRADRIDSHPERAVGTVLEADREGETAGEFAVQLRFGGASADGADGEAVGEELRRDGVEHLAGERHAFVG